MLWLRFSQLCYGWSAKGAHVLIGCYFANWCKLFGVFDFCSNLLTFELQLMLHLMRLGFIKHLCCLVCIRWALMDCHSLLDYVVITLFFLAPVDCCLFGQRTLETPRNPACRHSSKRTNSSLPTSYSALEQINSLAQP